MTEKMQNNYRSTKNYNISHITPKCAKMNQQTQNVAKWVKRGTNELQTLWKMHQTLNVDTKQPGFNFNVFHKSWKRCSSNTVPDPDATTTMLGAVFSPSLPQTCLLSLWPNSSVFVFLAHPFGQLWIPAELEGVDFGAGAPSCPWCCKMSFTVAGFSLGCSRLFLEILTHFLPSRARWWHI